MQRLSNPWQQNQVMRRMLGRWYWGRVCRSLILLWMAFFAMHAMAQSVVFINPGKSNEAYWVAASQAMEKAAQSLGMRLRIVYGERQRLEPIRLAQEIAQLPADQRPDYVIFSNEYNVASSVLRALEGTGIKAFMAFSGRQGQGDEQLGQPREIFDFWLGSLEPNAEEAGYMTAKALLDEAAKRPDFKDAQGRIQLLTMAGDRSTPSSIARNKGMQRALEEAGDQVVQLQTVYAEWRTDKAYEQSKVLFQRYPQVRLVWCGNDLIAFGAMQAWRERGGQPGQDVLFSGINTSQQAFQQLRSGELTALAGGHFLPGAWAMVMLYDYHHGVDFIDEGLEIKRNMFVLFDAKSSKQFEKKLANQNAKIDFRAYSKHLNPKIKHYDFDLSQLLH